MTVADGAEKHPSSLAIISDGGCAGRFCGVSPSAASDEETQGSWQKEPLAQVLAEQLAEKEEPWKRSSPQGAKISVFPDALARFNCEMTLDKREKAVTISAMAKKLVVVRNESATHEVHLEIGDPPKKVVGGQSLDDERLKAELALHGCSSEVISDILRDLDKDGSTSVML